MDKSAHTFIFFFLFTNARAGIATGSNAADAWTPTQRVQWVEGGNIFADFSALANEHGAVNLGQGFPSFQVPDFLVQALEESARTQLHHQYTRPGGHPELVSALASFYEPRYGRKLDPLSNVVVCNGAQEGLFVAITTFCEEVRIMFRVCALATSFTSPLFIYSFIYYIIIILGLTSPLPDRATRSCASSLTLTRTERRRRSSVP